MVEKKKKESEFGIPNYTIQTHENGPGQQTKIFTHSTTHGLCIVTACVVWCTPHLHCVYCKYVSDVYGQASSRTHIHSEMHDTAVKRNAHLEIPCKYKIHSTSLHATLKLFRCGRYNIGISLDSSYYVIRCVIAVADAERIRSLLLPCMVAV